MYTKTHEVMLDKEIKKLKADIKRMNLIIEKIVTVLEKQTNATINRKITEDLK